MFPPYVMSKQMYYQIPIIYDEQTWFDYLNLLQTTILASSHIYTRVEADTSTK